MFTNISWADCWSCYRLDLGQKDPIHKKSMRVKCNPFQPFGPMGWSSDGLSWVVGWLRGGWNEYELMLDWFFFVLIYFLAIIYF